MRRSDGDGGKPAEQDSSQWSGFAGSDVPTPPSGFAMNVQGSGHDRQPEGGSVPGADDVTPPSGIAGLVGADGIVGRDGVVDTGPVISDADIAPGGPAVLGGEDPVASDPRDDAGDWPTLEYRSRNKSQSGGTFDWLRRRDS